MGSPPRPAQEHRLRHPGGPAQGGSRVYGRGFDAIPGGHGRLWDHESLWIRHGTPVVLVAQPYGIHGDDYRQLAYLEDRLNCTVLTDAASWWNPGSTVLVEVWAPGVERRPTP